MGIYSECGNEIELTQTDRRGQLMKSKRIIKVIGIALIIAFCIAVSLFAIFVPRDPYYTKKPRLKADIRTLATGLETYYVDNNTYPPMNEDCLLPVILTTPITYLSDWPDHTHYSYQKGIGDLPLRYYFLKNKNQYIIQNCGPDGDYDLTEYQLLRLVNAEESDEYLFLCDSIYDPTNGSNGSGDILFDNKYSYKYF